MRRGFTASIIARVTSTIISKVSSVRFFGSGPSHWLPRDPLILTQQRAPIRSASSSWERHFAIAAPRSFSSALKGLLHAPVSAIARPALSAASA